MQILPASLTLEERYEQYQRDGYTLFEGFYDSATMDALREEFHFQQRRAALAGLEDRETWWFGNMLERAPELMWRMIHRPDLLDFAERVMGPYVQLDNLTLSAFPTRPEKDFMKINNWHRDRWAHLPRGVYERPNAINAICYGQDMDEHYGPLRVIPGSHLVPITIPKEARNNPQPGEVLVFAKRGDVILTHNGLIHSGTLNTSGHPRHFFSIYLNQTWMKPTDNLNGPGVAALVKVANKRNDRRALRLLGQDPLLKERNNWGFLVPDDEKFAEWLEEDRAALTGE